MEDSEFRPVLATVPPIRRQELERIITFVESAREGALLVAGGLGLGKSRLLDAVGANVTDAVYEVHINPAEFELPQSGLSAILAVFGTPEAILLSESLLAQSAAPRQPAELASDLLAFFRRTATTSSLLLIDDLDLMDEASQAVIAMVATRLAGSRLRLICTVSEIPYGGLFASLSHMGLAPLGFDDSLQWLSELAGPQGDEAVLRMVSTVSSGIPGALVRNLHSLGWDELVGDAPITFPFRPLHEQARVGDLVVSQVSANRRTLLARLSCARLTNYGAMGLRPGNPTRALEELLGEGIVLHHGNYLRIRDPLLRSRVYWSMDAASRREYHAAAAEAEASEEPGLAAWHRSWLDHSIVLADELLRSAEAFTGQGFIGQATELAERALALDGGAAFAADRLLDLAQAMFLQGELARADRYARFAQQQQTGTAANSSRLGMLRAQIEFMSTQQLRVATSDKLFTSRNNETAGDAAYSLATIAVYHAKRWEVDAAKEALVRARQLLKGATSETVERIDLATMVIAALEGDSAPALKFFDTLSRRGLAETSVEDLILLGQSLTFLREHGEARKVFKAIIGREPASESIWLETAKYELAENEILAGNQLEALATIDLLHSSYSGMRLHRNLHLLLMSWYWQAAGERAAMEAAIAECHSALATGENPALSARLEGYQGGFALVQGRLDEAIAFLKSTAVCGASSKIPILFGYQVDLIEAYVLSGRLDEAVEAFQDLRSRAMPYRTRWAMLVAARAGALVIAGEPSIGLFEEAVKLWRPGDSRFELGRTLMSYGDRLTGLGRIRQGREQYLAARIVFTEQGATAWAMRADAARADRDDLAPEHPLLAALTTEERLVAALACRGMRNKEIAQELFVSLRTVEVRLTKIYHKLGVSSRAHMIAMLSGLNAVETNAPDGVA